MFNLRPLTVQDDELLFNWRNSEFIVARSSSQKAVTWAQHQAWFASLCSADNMLAYIIEADKQAVGHIRLERQVDNISILTVYLVEQSTGKGGGTWAIQQACLLAGRCWPENTIVAQVRQDNHVAQASFKKAGFLLSNKCPLQDHYSYELVTPDLNQEKNKAHYTQQFELYGNSIDALNWGSQRSQYKRFQVLSQMADLNSQRILDVGSGLGDFFQWLIHLGIKPEAMVGVDITPCFVEQAKDNVPQADFELADILVDELQPVDFVFSSGVFSYCLDDPYGFLEKMVARMFELSLKGVAFNCLSSQSQHKSDGEFYANPAEVYAICQRISPWLTLRHDYHPGDFTVYLRKEAL